MRRFVSGGIALALALSAAAAWGAKAPVKDPAKGEDKAERPSGRLEIDTDVVDVGNVVRGEVVTGTFLLKNTGDETLKILSAKPG